MTGQPRSRVSRTAAARIAARRRRRRWLPVTGLAVAGAVAAAAAGTVAVAQSGDPGTVPDSELVDRLVAIEQQLPPLPPDAVVVLDDATWAELTGDFTGAEAQLETVVADTRTLFSDADEADGEVADAVAAAARALLLLHEAYGHLAEYETHDLAFPLDTFDEDGVATGADVLYGEAATGLDLILEARAAQVPAYEVLAVTHAADPAEQALFDERLGAAETFRSHTRPAIRQMLSAPTTQELVTVDRFGTLAPGAEPRAQSLTVVCIEREAYEAAYESGDTADLTAALAAAEQAPAADCPELPDPANRAQPVG